MLALAWARSGSEGQEMERHRAQFLLPECTRTTNHPPTRPTIHPPQPCGPQKDLATTKQQLEELNTELSVLRSQFEEKTAEQQDLKAKVRVRCGQPCRGRACWRACVLRTSESKGKRAGLLVDRGQGSRACRPRSTSRGPSLSHALTSLCTLVSTCKAARAMPHSCPLTAILVPICTSHLPTPLLPPQAPCTHARTHTHARAHTHARTHPHTHTPLFCPQADLMERRLISASRLIAGLGSERTRWSTDIEELEQRKVLDRARGQGCCMCGGRGAECAGAHCASTLEATLRHASAP